MTSRDETIEAIARAIWEVALDDGIPIDPWDAASDDDRAPARQLAAAALDAILALPEETRAAAVGFAQVGWLAPNGALLEYVERYAHLAPSTDRPVYVASPPPEPTNKENV